MAGSGKGKPKKERIGLRVALFVLALGVAVTSFTLGITQLGHRDPGWYEIDLTAEARAELFGTGLHLTYRFEGDGASIRQRMNALQKDFSAIQRRYARMLDPANTYDDVVSVAAVAQAGGEPVQISEELYEALSDALARTQRGEGYSVFSGPVHDFWQDIRYLDEPADFDPAQNPDQKERLDSIVERLAMDGALTLTLDASDGVYTAAFTASDTWTVFADAREIDAPVLDLNLLKDAWLTELTARALIENGWTDGFLYTDSGLTRLLGGEGPYYADVYGPEGDGIKRIASLSVSAPGAVCRTTAAAMPGVEYGWYAVGTENGTLLRHPWLDARTGGFGDTVLTCLLASGEEDLVELTYRAIRLNASDSVPAFEALYGELCADIDAVVTLQGAPEGDVYMSPSAAERVAAVEE